ncbi:fused MFS/spermidine synthase [Candidatus Nomurabacteria bacterium]|nr:fused MFS/spermidine synthase [Candidatus Kaiserbacteria bacterium]MCB9814785.1 fused MFS/spermidine synthase [Candidatus Nomurabacteria bacterium]
MTAGSPLLVDTVSNQSPAFSVLLTLLFGVGLPVVLLASTSVITQYLYARLTDKEPYSLYALSNVGSLLGLIAYPFIFELYTSLIWQAAWWTIGFIIFFMMLLIAWKQVEMLKTKVVAPAHKFIDFALNNRWRIVFMAAIPTFMLASLTEFLSKGIASFPLLWVIPLMLYLVSFIIAFGNRASFTPKIPFGFWALISTASVFFVFPIISQGVTSYWVGFVIIMFSFLVICTYFHHQVYKLRPDVSDLGSFYVYMTLGGALGSGVVGIILPLLLNDQIEIFYAFSLLVLYFSYNYIGWLPQRVPKLFKVSIQWMIFVLAFVLVLSSLPSSRTVVTDRNFYGTLKVVDSVKKVDGEKISVRIIANGHTNHGFQALDERYEYKAASYYGPNSGIDIAIKSFVDRGISPKVNVVGLGAGMMNAYCGDVELISYLEINPAVERLAREYFTYLEMCPDKNTVTIGDGRLLLEKEVQRGEVTYDVIMMDAFTDDAIPVHLLTKEAFNRAYKPLLSEDGVMAFHISNRYLNLFPPIVGMARDSGYEAVTVSSKPDGTNEMYLPTVWVLVTSPLNAERILSTYPNSHRYEGKVIVWTDYKNSVMSSLSSKGSWLE